MHFVRANGILSSKNGMNIYRGCPHGCIYCDSRSRCYHIDHDFEDVGVKENALELLENALRKKRSKCMIGTGSMSDPYNPIETDLKYTRGALLLAEKYGFGFTVITKSDLVLRDIDIMRRINEKSKCVVQMTMTTYDENLCRIIEPHVSTAAERAEALKKLRDAGIPTIVWLCPLLPYINDTEENLLGIMNLCADAGVKGILCFGIGMTLREGNREYFYKCLDEHFPGMKERYISAFGDRYSVLSPHNSELMEIFHSFCRSHNIMHDTKEIFSYLNEFPAKGESRQTTLF